MLYYVISTQGVVQECLTEDNSCYFTNCVCGRHYSFTVYSITGQCRSQVSSTADIRTGMSIIDPSQQDILNIFEVLYFLHFQIKLKYKKTIHMYDPIFDEGVSE